MMVLAFMMGAAGVFVGAWWASTQGEQVEADKDDADDRSDKKASAKKDGSKKSK